jgi:hypothetical protein
MKVKDLLKYNPEADICLLGLDYTSIPLKVYGWSSNDCEESCDTKLDTDEILLIAEGLDEKYKIKTES